MKERNRLALEYSKPRFTHPTYPEPYSSYPDCTLRAINFFDSFPRSGVWTHLPKSTDEEPYSARNLGYAERAISHYRERVSYPSFSTSIAEYPVPDWLNAMTRDNLDTSSSYSRIEVEAGFLIEWFWDYVIPVLNVRNFCIAAIGNTQDPRQILIRIRTKKFEDTPLRYLNGIIRRFGETIVESPIESEEITEIQKPDLSKYVKDWKPGIPEYDSSFDCAAPRSELIPEITMDRLTWLEEVRANLDPVRAKMKLAKMRKFG